VGIWGAIEIFAGRNSNTYLCRELPTDFGPGNHAYELVKLDAAQRHTLTAYHVLVTGHARNDRCDCLGHERYGHCKHSAALAALCQAGARRKREIRSR
jgi:hypothetical protein